MRLANLAHLYRIRLRSRLVAELLALAGIAAGVALVFAALVASTSLTGSVRQLTEGIVGESSFQLSARSSAGFTEEVVGEVRGIDGVAAVAPVVDVRANLVGPSGLRSVLLVGADPRFGRVGGRLLEASVPARKQARPGLLLPAALAAELGVEPGEMLRVETGAGVARVRVAARLDRGEIGSLAESPFALAPLELAQALTGLRGEVSRVFVRSAPGRDHEVGQALREVAADRYDIGPADREVAIFEQAAYPTNQSTALFSVLSALVGFLFALNAVLLTVPQRRRLIADLRMAGYEPGTIVRLVLFDALVLGAAGAILGLTLGDQASRHLFDSAPAYLSSAFPIGSQRIVTWSSVAIAATAGILAACVAVVAPIRDALARDPRAPEAISTRPRRQAWLTLGALAFAAVTALILIAAPWAALAGIASLTISLLLFLPVTMQIAARAFEAIGRRTKSPAAILAVLELSAGGARIRTLALAATGAIAVFATVSIGGARADLQRGLDASTVDVDDGAEVWVAFRGPTNIFATTPFALSPGRIAAIARQPGVDRVDRGGGSFLDVGDYRVWVQAPPRSTPLPFPKSQAREGDPDLANARLRGQGWVSLSEGVADHLDVDVGDQVVLPSPVPTPLRVAAITTNLGWPGGAIVLNVGDYARAWGTGAPSTLMLQLDGSATAEEVAASVRRVLGPGSPLRTETRATRTQRQLATSRSGLSRLSQISAMVLISAVLAMAASMGGVIWQRRSTLAALKVHGLGELDLWLSLLLESALLLGTGCLVGAVFGLSGQLLLDRALATITGFPVFYSFAGPLAVGVILLVTAVAVAVLAIPGWLAVRVRPMTGIPT